MPRAGNASGGGQPGWIVKCKGWETDPNAYIYVITQAAGLAEDLRGHRQARMDRRTRITPRRRPASTSSTHIFDTIEALDHDQDEVRGDGHPQPAEHALRPDPLDEGNRRGAVACARPARWSRSIIPTRGKYLTVGNPIKLSDSPADVQRSPLLGEHTEEIMSGVLGLSADEIEAFKQAGAVGKPPAAAAE